MLTDLERLQRRGARLRAELEKAEAQRDKWTATLCKAVAHLARLHRAVRGLKRRCDRVADAVGAVLRQEKRQARQTSTPKDGQATKEPTD